MKVATCDCKHTQCKELTEQELHAAFDKFYQINDSRLQKLTLLNPY